jgi:hypothetical protein
MIWVYVAVVFLVGLIVIPNALYAFRKFLENRNFLLLCVYFGFLILLVVLILHVTKRTTELVQDAKNVYMDVEP